MIGAEVKYAGYNIKRGTCTAYFVQERDEIKIGQVIIDNYMPCDNLGAPLHDDGITRELIGWRHCLCQSFSGGKVLVPLRDTSNHGAVRKS